MASPKRGKAIMVLGATSDAGKSITAMAFCRILSDMGYRVMPFKSQNMSLNAKPTPDGHEISMIQTLQCQAARVEPTFRVNPILMKPTSDMRSQVVVEGKVFGVYGVEEYYNDFIPNHSGKIVKENADWILAHNDIMIMEGAGSPAEINIYDKDIANMRAAEIADADCILVVNMEWGGSFAYVLGTIMLMPEGDRRRIKAVLYNNFRGKKEYLDDGIRMIEERTGIPCLGVIPHMDHRLPPEDSESLRGVTSVGEGRTNVGIIRLPRMANFTDIDPFYCENVKVTFVSDREQLDGCDLIVIPGTKNSMMDMKWMNESGMAKAIRESVGKKPIVGVCGGYQMLGRKLHNPKRYEDPDVLEIDGLGIFDMETTWDREDKITVRNRGKLLITGEEVTGYQIHVGRTETREEPLFEIETGPEGSCRKEDMVFGTYLHGVFEMPAFRRYVLSIAGHSSSEMCQKDYSESLEESIDAITAGFRDNMDMSLFKKITGVERWR